MILTQTIDYLKSLHEIKFDEITIRRLVFGLRLTAVELSDGSCGMASTYDVGNSNCKSRNFGEFSPNKYCDKKVVDLFNTEKQSGLIDTLKLAVLNALSGKLIDNKKYKIFYDTDPIELLENIEGKKISLVGAFKSYMEKFSKIDCDFRILELNQNAIPDCFQKYYFPANQYQTVIPDSDIIIITGLSLVNNTLDNLVATVKYGTQVVITGPSANIAPEVLFKNKVSIIGASKITNKELLFMMVSEAASGYHLFGHCVQKICIKQSFALD